MLERVSDTQRAIEIQPGALLATASSATPLERLNAALQPYGLWLPIVPLVGGLTLAELVRRNTGGRRQPGHGTIARYLRAATIQPPDPPHDQPHSPPARLTIGGPTLKRATGYDLTRALVAGDRLNLGTLHDLTLQVRPLPAARCEMLIACADLPAACRLAAQLVATNVGSSGLALSALAVMDALCASAVGLLPAEPPGALLLAELEGFPAIVERQASQLATLAGAAGTILHTRFAPASAAPDEPSPESSWPAWEALATREEQGQAPALVLNLPRTALPAFIAQATALARRYGLGLPMWGDAGIGTLHIGTESSAGTAHTAGELAQVAALLTHQARSLGGAISTDQPAHQAQHAHPAPPDPLAALPAPVVAPTTPTTPTAPIEPIVPGAQAMAPETLLARLAQAIGAPRVLTRPGDLLCYAADASIARADGLPLAVALPDNTADVCAVLHLASAAGVPVVTRGAGSGLAGGATPTAGALVLSLNRMQRMRIDPAQQVAHVEAGVMTGDLQKAAEAAGLLYAPDPSSQSVSTIGGNIACNAGGPRCLKYGVTSSYVLGLTAALADGTLLRLGDGIAAQTPDVGLLNLLIGSEGTLAVITEATLRLIARPAARRTTLALFDRLDDACATVEAIMASGLLPASLELLDDTCIGVVEDAQHLGLPRDAGALLLLLADGEPEAVEWEATQLAELARRGGARNVRVAQNASDEAAFWWARRAVSPAFARVRPNKLSEDLCVPLPKVAETVRRIKRVAARYDVPIPVFGHAGDGNLHPNILFDARDQDEAARAWHAAKEVFRVALALGGTLSGEHGIGMLKRPLLAEDLGADVLALHHTIKARFDPHSLLNPGKAI